MTPRTPARRSWFARYLEVVPGRRVVFTLGEGKRCHPGPARLHGHGEPVAAPDGTLLGPAVRRSIAHDLRNLK
jgi:uncharacterized protein YndB with AHSA1/START domain